MTKILLSRRMRKTAERLPRDLREEASEAIAAVAESFGDPHRHRGLGLRKLGERSYEARLGLQWRIVFLHDAGCLVAYDIMTHDQVARWLRAR